MIRLRNLPDSANNPSTNPSNLGEHLEDVDESFKSGVWGFFGFTLNGKQSGLFTYDEEAAVYLEPGAHPASEDVRVLWSLSDQRGATLSEDPRGERNLLSDLLDRHLQDLAAVATGKATYVLILLSISIYITLS